MAIPTVSVIVPCHNGGGFLDGLLDNLSRQTFRDFEIVIVNNGSTERATLDKLAQLERTVQVIHQENRYLPGARNTGFREARAPLVLPLDCDDRLEPSFLSETVDAMGGALDDVGFVFTHMRLTGSLRGVLARRYNAFDQLFLNRLPYCMLIRKTAWAEVGGYDENMRDGDEDWEFNIALAKAGFRGIELPKPLFLYAVRPDGMLMSKSARIQGTIWRYIRDKHRDSYRLDALTDLWRDAGGGLPSIAKATCLYTMAALLPDAWFNVAFFRLFAITRSIRILRGRLQVAPGPN